MNISQCPILSIKDLSVHFKDRVALRNINLEVKAGEFLVLMGRSGSGKSTLLRCMNGLQQPTSGKVQFNLSGETLDLADCGRTHAETLRRRHISMVFQQFALFPWRTAIENVAFGLELQGVAKEARRQRATEFLKMVDLSEAENLLPAELSGGMQQRVGIARALATGAEILLMDEPFSALDPVNRKLLQKEVRRLQSQLGKTIIFVTHDADEAIALGQRIAIVERGEIIQCASPEGIRAQPKNKDVAQFFAEAN
jgi:glycine betaine/proline transport system ATP-binding protein